MIDKGNFSEVFLQRVSLLPISYEYKPTAAKIPRIIMDKGL